MASQHSRECLVQKLHLYGHLGFKEVRIHGAFEEINSFVKFPSKSERQFVHPWLFTTKPWHSLTRGFGLGRLPATCIYHLKVASARVVDCSEHRQECLQLLCGGLLSAQGQIFAVLPDKRSNQSKGINESYLVGYSDFVSLF